MSRGHLKETPELRAARRRHEAATLWVSLAKIARGVLGTFAVATFVLCNTGREDQIVHETPTGQPVPGGVRAT